MEQASSSSNSAAWSIDTVLPAMCIDEPINCGPVVFCTTKHLPRYQLADAFEANGISELEAQYHDARGDQLASLGVMLLPSHRSEELDNEDIGRISRDAIALCFVTGGTARNMLQHGGNS